MKVFRMHKEARLPEYASEQSACFDIRAFLMVPERKIKAYSPNNQNINKLVFKRSPDGPLAVYIDPGERVLIPTGLVFDIPEGHSVRIHARSGLSLKGGIRLANGEGIIDADYTQETFVMLTNASNETVEIRHGDRIAQGELVPVTRVRIEETTDPIGQKTDRSGGFGSTGVN